MASRIELRIAQGRADERSISVTQFVMQITTTTGDQNEIGIIGLIASRTSEDFALASGGSIVDAVLVADAVAQRLSNLDRRRAAIAARKLAFINTPPYQQERATRAAALISTATDGWDHESVPPTLPPDADWLRQSRPVIEEAVDCTSHFSHVLRDRAMLSDDQLASSRAALLVLETKAGQALLEALLRPAVPTAS